jgi:hypothetical protein
VTPPNEGRPPRERPSPSGSTPGDDREWLEGAAARLRELARRLAEPGLAPEELGALAEEAGALSAEIGERLPRALRPPPREG